MFKLCWFAAEEPAEHYEEWMKNGVSVITPNKKAGSGPLARYKAIKAQEKQSFQHFFYEVSSHLAVQYRQLPSVEVFKL